MLESKALPKYRCHKIVSAMQVYSVSSAVSSDPLYVGLHPRLLMPVDRDLSPITVSAEWARKHLSPFISGMYYVVYEDGYASMSPAKAFEDGYALMPCQTVEECITDSQQRAIVCLRQQLSAAIVLLEGLRMVPLERAKVYQFLDSLKAQPNYVKATDSSSVPPAGQKPNDPQVLLTEIRQQLGHFADAMKVKGHTVHLSIVPTHVDLSLRPTTPIHLSWNVSDTYRVAFKKDAFEQAAKDLPRPPQPTVHHNGNYSTASGTCHHCGKTVGEGDSMALYQRSDRLSGPPRDSDLVIFHRDCSINAMPIFGMKEICSRLVGQGTIPPKKHGRLLQEFIGMLSAFEGRTGHKATEIRISIADHARLGEEMSPLFSTMPLTVLSGHFAAPHEGVSWYSDASVADGKPVIK